MPTPMTNENSGEFEISENSLEKLDTLGLHACPVCECESWYIMQAPGKHLPMLPLTDNGVLHSMPTGGYSLIALACQRCGFVKAHVKPILEDYLARLNRDKPSADHAS